MDKSFSLMLQTNRKILNPPIITLFAMIILVATVVIENGGDPLELARIGTRFSLGDPQGTQGYDGQFVYYIALDPNPRNVALYLDVPAYRYQRILLPVLGRILAFGSPKAIPWVLPAVLILSQFVGTLFVSKLLNYWGVNHWYALIYGLWCGFSAAVRLDLPEPLAYALVMSAVYCEIQDNRPLSWLLYGFALFAKEVTFIFLVASLIDKLIKKQWRDVLGVILVAVLPFMLFQIWLLEVFGQFGIGSGGAMATSFELVPYMGILRIGYYSPVYLIAMLVVFGPSIIIPSIWGIGTTVKKLISREFNVLVFIMFLNALSIAFIPFSTFRETGGLLRFSCGLVASVLLYCGRYRMYRILNYAIFWLVLNVILIKS